MYVIHKFFKAFFIKPSGQPFFKKISSKFQRGICKESYYGECMRHLNVRISENIGISQLTSKQFKPKKSSVANHFLLCNHSVSYDDFSVLTHENKKFLLELKAPI